MAVLSPALVVSMCVMFVLTRLHAHYYIFENPILFGLKYCLEPDREQIQAIHQAATPTSSKQSSTRKKAKHVTAKSKHSVSSLLVRRTILDASFFSAEADFPHHRQLDHLLTICAGYLAAYLFEDILSCFYPTLFTNSRSSYVAVFAVAFALYELGKISTSLAPMRLLLGILAISWVIALSLVSAGNFTSFFHFHDAFSALSQSAISTMTERLHLSTTIAQRNATYLVVFARLFVAGIAALITACVAAPARRFSRIDHDLHRQYRQDEQSLREDPYALDKPTASTMLAIALDYVAPAFTLFVWCVTPRTQGVYGAWRLSALVACVVVRVQAMRVRLQAYLDGAIDSYRMFWTDKMMSDAVQAGQRCTFQVVGTSFYLFMITVAYVAPAAIATVFALVAKRDGGVVLGLCPRHVEPATALDGAFAREIGAFLAWWCLGSYVVFALVSVGVEMMIDVLDPGARDRGVKLPPASSSSERRRQKRMMRSAYA